MSAKHYGVTASIYLDGQGYDGSVSLTCDHTGEFDYKCPFALHEFMPMTAGQHCMRKNGGECPVVAAKLDALRKAEAMIKREIKRIESEAEA